jgi:hypothetical protein
MQPSHSEFFIRLIRVKAGRAGLRQAEAAKQQEGRMARLAAIIYTLAATALAGMAVTAVLTLGWFSLPAIIGAAAAGAVLALPVSYMVARALV